jgi:uncharacterized glyoxalase superfamily protein PhnB
MNNPNTASGSTIIPCLAYRDAATMIEWLCKTFGFAKKSVYPDDAGRIMHAELTLGAGMVMISSTPAAGDDSPWARLSRQPDEIDGAETQSPAVYVSDPDAVYSRVKQTGGRIVMDIEDKGYGGRGFTCRDPEGHVWHIGSYDAWKS